MFVLIFANLKGAPYSFLTARENNFWKSCPGLFQFQNIYRMNTRHCPSVLTTKEESTRFAGGEIL